MPRKEYNLKGMSCLDGARAKERRAGAYSRLFHAGWHRFAILCTTMVYTGATIAMAKRARTKSARAKHVRRSVSLPPKIARQVETLARQRDLSDNRVLVELIEQGIEAQQQKEKSFFQLAERFRAASDPEQVKQLGDQLGRFVFGNSA